MSIKADRWIVEQARAGMIEPFDAGQVREKEGYKIISYGTSSYGYDVRCADEFKIFTNINSTIVDPKAFDAKNFVLSSSIFIVDQRNYAVVFSFGQIVRVIENLIL